MYTLEVILVCDDILFVPLCVCCLHGIQDDYVIRLLVKTHLDFCKDFMSNDLFMIPTIWACNIWKRLREITRVLAKVMSTFILQ